MATHYCGIYTNTKELICLGESKDQKLKPIIRTKLTQILEEPKSKKLELKGNTHFFLTFLKIPDNKIIICIGDMSDKDMKNLISKVFSSISQYDKKSPSKLSNNALYNDYSNIIENILKENDSGKRIISEINNDIANLKIDTKKNIKSVLNAQTDLNELLVKSDNIKDDAFEYQSNACELKKTARWQYIMMNLCIITIIVGVVWMTLSISLCGNFINPFCSV